MATGELGKVYPDGELIIREGQVGTSMYVIEEGEVEVLVKGERGDLRVAVLGTGDFFGEMALFDEEVRSATVRARGDVRAITVDKRNLLRRIREDPTLAFRLIDVLSRRLRDLDHRVSQLVRSWRGGARPTPDPGPHGTRRLV